MLRVTLYGTRNCSNRTSISLFSDNKTVLKLAGICGIATAVCLLLGFLVGENVAATFGGTSLSNGEYAGTLQTYGEPLEELLVRLDKASMFHIVSRILFFAASLLSIPMLLALHFVTRDRKTPYGFLSLLGLVLGAAAATSFAASHVVTGPLSLDIANQYAKASTDVERRSIVATAEELDASIGITALDNIFMAIGLVLVSIVFFSFGLAMVKTRLFQRWLGLSSIVIGILAIVGFIAGSLTGLGGVAFVPVSFFGLAWFIIVGYNIHQLSKGILDARP